MEAQDSILLKVLAKDGLYFTLKEIESMLIEMNSLEPTKTCFPLDQNTLFTWESSSFCQYPSAKAWSHNYQKTPRLQKSVDMKI